MYHLPRRETSEYDIPVVRVVLLGGSPEVEEGFGVGGSPEVGEDFRVGGSPEVGKGFGVDG